VPTQIADETKNSKGKHISNTETKWRKTTTMKTVSLLKVVLAIATFVPHIGAQEDEYL